jgi:hypothetical protein
MPTWKLLFPHPQNGQARIVVQQKIRKLAVRNNLLIEMQK